MSSRHPPTQILLVCMGNICRSPTAEAIARAQAHARGLGGRVMLDSAGTHAYHVGEAPDPRAIASARQAGYDLTALRARQVNATDFARFDWIIVADRQNLAELQRRCPADQQHKLQLMCAWLEGQDVPDPYYGGPEGFVDMIHLLEQAMAAMLAQLCPSQPAAQRGTPGGTDAH